MKDQPSFYLLLQHHQMSVAKTVGAQRKGFHHSWHLNLIFFFFLLHCDPYYSHFGVPFNLLSPLFPFRGFSALGISYSPPISSFSLQGVWNVEIAFPPSRFSFFFCSIGFSINKLMEVLFWEIVYHWLVKQQMKEVTVLCFWHTLMSST